MSFASIPAKVPGLLARRSCRVTLRLCSVCRPEGSSRWQARTSSGAGNAVIAFPRKLHSTPTPRQEPRLKEEEDLQDWESEERQHHPLDQPTTSSRGAELFDRMFSSTYKFESKDAGPSLADLQEAKPRTRRASSVKHMSPEGRNRFETRLWSTALRQIQSSFTVAQLRSLARKANLKGIRSTTKKAELARRLVTEVWQIYDPVELAAQRQEEEAATMRNKVPLTVKIPYVAWVLLNVDHVQRRKIERRNSVRVELREPQLGTVIVTGSELAKNGAREDLNQFAETLRMVQFSLPEYGDATASDPSAAQRSIPQHILQTIMAKSHCIALPNILDDPSASDEPPSAGLRFNIFGSSEEACDFAASLLRSYWASVRQHGSQISLVLASTGRPKQAMLLTIGSGEESQELKYHASPFVPPSVTPWTIDALLGKGTQVEGPPGLADALMLSRIARSKPQGELHQLYFGAPVKEKKKLTPLGDLSAATLGAPWDAIGKIEEGENIRYSTTFGSVVLKSEDGIGLAAAPLRAGQPAKLSEILPAVEMRESSSVFLPITPPEAINRIGLGAGGLGSRSKQSSDPEIMQLIYEPHEGGSRQLVVEMRFVKDDETHSSTRNDPTWILGARAENVGEDTAEARTGWRVARSFWRDDKAAMVLAPDSPIDLLCVRHVERPVILEEAQVNEINAAIPPNAYLLPDDATDSPSRSNKPLPSPADDPDGQVFLPPSFLPSPDADASPPLQLVKYARILRTTWAIPTDESRGPELDPREAGYLPPEPDTNAEGEEEEARGDELEQFDKLLVQECVAEPGEAHVRTEIKLQWQPREGATEKELRWRVMRKTLDPWLDGQYDALWEGRGRI